MVNNKMDALEWLRKQLDGDENDLLREWSASSLQRLMAAEVDALTGAGWGEQSPERVNHPNGYRWRPFDTRVGTIDLAIPKLSHRHRHEPQRHVHPHVPDPHHRHATHELTLPTVSGCQ